MDYDRNSFAKNIESLATLYDVRYTYNKHRALIHSDDGLKEKFSERITNILERTTCPLMVSAVEEILELLEEEVFPIEKKSYRSEVKEEAVEEIAIKKKRPPLFQQDSNNLEDFFNNKTNAGNLLEEVSLEVIKKALEIHEFNLTKTSEHLGISHRTLRAKIQDIKDRETV